MLIQISPIQVPTFWEVIKFASIKANGINTEQQLNYSIVLLQDLLAGKQNAFIVYNDKNAISIVVIVSFKYDLLKDESFLFNNCIYSFEPQEKNTWAQVLADLSCIAKTKKCTKIIGDTVNPKMMQILEANNVVCVSKKYEYTL